MALAFVKGIHRWPGVFPSQTVSNAEMFPIDDVIMTSLHQVTVWLYSSPGPFPNQYRIIVKEISWNFGGE